jgi:hypothetical protein
VCRVQRPFVLNELLLQIVSSFFPFEATVPVSSSPLIMFLLMETTSKTKLQGLWQNGIHPNEYTLTSHANLQPLPTNLFSLCASY